MGRVKLNKRRYRFFFRHTFQEMIDNLIILARGDYDPKKRWFYFMIMSNPMCPKYESSDDLIYDLRQCWEINLFEEEDLKQEIYYYFYKWCSKKDRKYVLRKFYPLMCKCIKDYIILSKNLHIINHINYNVNISSLQIPTYVDTTRPLESIFCGEELKELDLIQKAWLFNKMLLLNNSNTIYNKTLCNDYCQNKSLFPFKKTKKFLENK